jgi:Ca2+-transporting ATPase
MLSLSRVTDHLRRSWPRVYRAVLMCWAIVWRALVKYSETDGEQRAASFAYYAFFSLFPLLLLLITIGTAFLGSDAHAQELAMHDVIGFMNQMVPVGTGQTGWFVEVLKGVVHSRGKAGIIAFAALAWSALRFFQALVHGVNKAWGTKEYQWWRLPIQNFFMVAIVASALFLGVFTPPAINVIEYYYWRESWKVELDFEFAKGVFWWCRQIVPTLVLFYGFSMFYKFAPRRYTKWREVWFSALLVVLALQVLQRLFVLYTVNISDFNRLYGTLGSVIALLMWIYLSGSVVIFGGCLAAAIYEVQMHITDQSERSTAR